MSPIYSLAPDLSAQDPQTGRAATTAARDPGRARELILALLLACLLILLFVAHHRPDRLGQIQARGVLKIGSEASLVSYLPGHGGFEYELAEAFARDLGVRLELTTRYPRPKLLQALREGQVDIAADGLIRHDARAQGVRWGPGYRKVSYQLIYRRGRRRPADLQALGAGPVDTVADPALAGLRAQWAQERPKLGWVVHQDLDAAELVELVWQDVIDYALVRSDVVALYRRFYPEIRVAFEASEPHPVAWAVSAASGSRLAEALDAFFAKIRADGRLAQIRDRYFGHLGALDYVTIRRFIRHIYERLPHYRDMIEDTAGQTGLDWRLLAAMAYQESHWDPRAVSPTGVRGLMMLTRATAAQLGIADRHDPEGSIQGGARYFRIVKAKLPLRVPEPDRTWLALAAYNVGFGHLEDARVLTQREGGDPDRWIDVKRRLPLLRKKRWYRQTKYGFARGDEPVQYVARIRNFYDILQWETGAIPGPRPRPPRALDILPEAL